jgi:hypothetical protein
VGQRGSHKKRSPASAATSATVPPPPITPAQASVTVAAADNAPCQVAAEELPEFNVSGVLSCLPPALCLPLNAVRTLVALLTRMDSVLCI